MTAERKTLAEVKIQRANFQSDTFSPSLFTITKMPHNHILRKCAGAYKFTNLQEKNNYVDDVQLFAKNEINWRLIKTLRTYSQDIGMDVGIEKCAMLTRSGKRQIIEGIELPNQEKIRTLREKENYKYLEILEVNIIK